MGNTMYMKRKSLSKYLINTIDFNTHDIEIFIDNTWQKYEGNIRRLFKFKNYFTFAFDQQESEVNFYKANHLNHPLT